MSFGSNPEKSDLILKDSTKIFSAEEYVVLWIIIDNPDFLQSTKKPL